MTKGTTGDDDVSFDIPTEEISFQRSQNYCVCFVDIMHSTRATVEISEPKKIRLYYAIFLNASVARSFGAKLVKNAGDAIIFYFPDSTDPANKSAFRDILECCATMIAGRDIVNIKLHSEGVEESINFRISADYGTFEVAASMSSRNEDLFGPTMNLCAKINAMARANEIVVGADLYRILKALSLDTDYKFNEIGSYSADKKHPYSVYKVMKYATTKNYSIGNLLDKSRSRANAEFSIRIADKERGLHNRQNAIDVGDQQHQKPRNIMLVDDEPDILLVYKSFLASEGYNVEVFTDPQEALAYFAKFSYSYYDLVILDIRMPHMNGFQLYQRLKAINKDVRILFVSALEIAEELSTLVPDINHNDIVKKPLSKENLLTMVKSKFDSGISMVRPAEAQP
jgi:two-component system response regulator ChvI